MAPVQFWRGATLKSDDHCGARVMPVYVYTTFDDPLTKIGDTDANGINDAGQIVGSYTDKDGRTHGYIFDAKHWDHFLHC